MATPTGVTWSRDPHTEAKHTILKRYLMGWFPAMTNTFGNTGVTFLDGFAGPGKYTNSDESSPVIALEQAHRTDLGRCPIRMLFIEADKRRAAHLDDVIEQRFPAHRRPHNLAVRVTPGECQKVFDTELASLGAWIGPIFANLDGWGADTPFEIVRRVAETRSSEVLVTLQEQFFVRFREHGAGDRVFGTSDWKQVSEQPTPAARHDFLLRLYRTQLHAAGFKYVLMFELCDERGHKLFLFFGTTNIRAVELFKDAVWHVDGFRGEKFKDPRHADQLAFEITAPDFQALDEELLRMIDSHGTIDLETLKTHVTTETIYKAQHTRPRIDDLVTRRRIEPVTNGRAHSDKQYRIAPKSLFD